MDFKKKYEEETKQNPYCWNEIGQYVRSGSYNDGYIKWLEEQLRQHDVVGRRELLCAFFKYFRDNGEANIGMTIEEFVDGFLSTQ